ncbi:protein mab-21-like 2 [Actinia tenebrosa]|uniref:Protein mab-21-like 2 n=1 Tax=Actinia tenebrosa TaxID=6105 RepID=A0A6P8GYP4_ACTTE|nr:protein mab-21-like 2 [Actinia tenebrosa]XP_031548643.1 protein mab-21-like 2 [Actinia tenebrosa]
MDNRELKLLLDRYFSQKVTLRQEEKRKALEVWEGVVKNILQKVEAKDPRFKLTGVYSGSYYERAKVKEPNEFDLMLEMEKLKLGSGDQYDSHEDNLGTDPPLGYTTVMIDQGEENEWRPEGCIPGNGNLLSATKVKSLFCRYVHEAITELGYSHCIEVKSSGPAVTLKITVGCKMYSIDLTLAIKDESWPDDADEWKTRHRGWPTRDLVGAIVRDGCHLVAKRPKQAFTTESEYFWRYSFSGAEKKLALQGERGEEGTCRKKILRILKLLREQYQLTPLTSYHLKTIMFYERETYPRLSLWKEDQLAIRFTSALARLRSCLQQRKCPHYFIKDVNLFDSRFDNRYKDLITWIDKFQSNPQNYLK